MLSNYYTLNYVGRTLNQHLAGAQIEEAFSQRKEECILTFRGHSRSLILSCQRQISTLYLHPEIKRARSNSADVLQGCRGKEIRSVSVHPSDRVVAFRFTDEFSLIAQFFGARSNVFLLDNNGNLRDTFKEGREIALQSFAWTEPLLDLTLVEREKKARPTQTIGATLKQSYPTLGSLLIAEICHRSSISERTVLLDLQNDVYTNLLRSMSEVFLELSRPSPRVYTGCDGRDLFALIPLRHLQADDCHFFEDVHEGIRFMVSRTLMVQRVDQERAQLVQKLQQQLERDRRTLNTLESDGPLRASLYERCGTLLLERSGEIPRGAREMHLSDDDGTIQLDPRLTPIQNAQRYFDKAKKAREASRQAEQRRKEIQQRMPGVERLLSDLERVETMQELRRVLKDQQEMDIDLSQRNEPDFPFRRFTVDGGFEVWVGKNSRNNDLLTLKHARPADLWFHARGSGGSHVVLKVGTGEPGKKAKEQAAAIAAYYSKMKSSSIVPVAMTQKKYVRKPKGAPPGSVVLEREKVLFVTPQLPRS
jgi:predicted ribosome quality control (RQC) complex YloA/Tae2 family protein